MVAYGLGVWGEASEQEGVITKEERFRGDEYVHYLDYGGGFNGIYICQNLSNFIF